MCLCFPQKRKPLKIRLPFGYCRHFFTSFHGCFSPQCSYSHVPLQEDEKVSVHVTAWSQLCLIRERKLSIFVDLSRTSTGSAMYVPSLTVCLQNILPRIWVLGAHPLCQQCRSHLLMFYHQSGNLSHSLLLVS